MAGKATDLRLLRKKRLNRDADDTKPNYGQRTAEYSQIVDRVVTEKDARSTIEALKERMKLLKLMLDDCCALVHKKKELKSTRRRRERLERFLPCLYVTLAVAVTLFGISATWFLVQIRPEGAVSL